MAVESPVGIQAVEPSNLGKIESFLNSTEYREIIEGSSTYNHRLCSERRMRIPWLDSQTGVAQNHSALLMAKRQRMPPLAAGQIYTYPRARWRKKRRQYLIINSRMLSRATDMLDGEGDLHSISQLENPSLHDTDSKDSQLLKDEKDWYFDDQEMLDIDGYDEPDADSDFDYEEDYRRRTKRRRGGKTRGVDSPSTPRRGKGGGRGRKKQIHNFDPVPGDSDKPFACDLCSARYKTRPGLTYHYTHSHRDPPNSDENSRDSPSLRVHTPVQIPSPQPGQSGSGSSNSASMLPATLPTGPQSSTPASFAGATPAPASFAGKGLAPQTTNAQTFGVATQSGGLQADSSAQLAPTNTQSTTSSVYQDSYVTFLNHPAGTPGRRGRQPNAPGMPQTPGSSTQTPPSLPPNPPPQSQSAAPDDPPMPVLVPERKVEAGSGVTPAASTSSETKEGSPDDSTASTEPASSSAVEKEATTETTSKDKAAPSPYCDFCLGDAKENKKTGTSEELVSCSDCGRSGHPTCLQFTPNMIISVRKYRWQCIECKCCSICGTSDNDDQLLFCDDCDRGYHMYCLSPPLSSPPEGFWSCTLCLVEFHK